MVSSFSQQRWKTKHQPARADAFALERFTMQRISVALLAILLISLSSCGGQSNPSLTPSPSPKTPKEGGTLLIFAAASLTESFQEIGKAFTKANPGVEVTFNFAGANQLAQQISQGAPADLFASANQKQMNVVIESGQVVSGTAKVFAHNRLIIVTSKNNPLVSKDLKGLAKPGTKVVLGAKEVPFGQYALDFLAKAAKDKQFGKPYEAAVLKNVVSYENTVKGALTKVMLGEADAGIVYASDLTPEATAKVEKIAIPTSLNVIATYPIAVLKGSQQTESAQRFVDFVLSPEGQAILTKYGFAAK